MNIKGILLAVAILVFIIYVYPKIAVMLGQPMPTFGSASGFKLPNYDTNTTVEPVIPSGNTPTETNTVDDLPNLDADKADILTSKGGAPSDIPTSYNQSSADPTATETDVETSLPFECNQLKRVALKDGTFKFFVFRGSTKENGPFPNVFFDARSFFDCYAPVKKYRNGNFNIIDHQGNIVTENIGEYKAIREFHEGFAGAIGFNNHFLGYINIHARLVLKLEQLFPNETFVNGTDFRDGKAYIQKSTGGFYQINAKGRKLKELDSCVLIE